MLPRQAFGLRLIKIVIFGNIQILPMKLNLRVILSCILLCFGFAYLPAQNARRAADFGHGSEAAQDSVQEREEDPCVPLQDARRCWTLDPMTCLVYPSLPDTSYLGLGNSQSMLSKALALVYTGNLYSPHLVQDFMARRSDHDFLFMNAYNLFRVDPSQQLYYNSKLPCTVLSYSKEGGGLQTNDHLKVNFFGNFNKRIGLGSNLEYVYARGEYPESSTKPLKWNSYLYYEGDQYKAYATFNLSKLANQESGGIANRDYILSPDEFKSNFTDPKNMPTNLANTWNNTDQRQVHFQHSYSLGKWQERIEPSDSSVWSEFVPIATIFQSFNFESLHHNFRMDYGADMTENGFWGKDALPYYSDSITADSTHYNDFSTYAGIRLNEGFNRFSQFSIGAFLGFEHQHYTLVQDTLNLGFIPRNHYSNTLWAGGQISRHLSSLLSLDATARTALSGDKAGDFDIQGTLQSVIPFGQKDAETGEWSDSIIASAHSFIKNTSAPYMMEHYFSNHLRWSNNFDNEQRVRIEGRLSYPRTRTQARVGVEHINRFHYFGADGLPHEYDKQLDIISVEIRQSLWAGKWLQWDNAALIQKSTENRVLPLPEFSIQSDLSFHFRIAKTLAIQAGVTGYYYTKYYAPTYQPATQQFCIQREYKCGNYPLLNGYVNCNLKRIKFFLAAHNMLENAVTNNMFIMPNYPNPFRRIEYGLILDLQN